MVSLFEVKKVDRNFYEKNIKDFLPEKIIDIHTHVWLKKHKKKNGDMPLRTVTWPDRVAEENTIEDLQETYRLLFPDKSVLPLIFSSPTNNIDLEAVNKYIKDCSKTAGCPSLLLSVPWWSGEELEEKVKEGCHIGCKAYLTMAAPYIPADEIRIYDFLPPHHLEVLNRNRWIAMLHIPRSKRLRDPVNLAQIMEIDKKYPDLKLIIAHVGRVYCVEDIGNAFEVLADSENVLFDFSANSNQYVFEKLIDTVGPKRILFGSDLPILRMRTRRICENSIYVNLVPKGLYGDVSGDRNMREIEGEEAEKLTFFMYEEIDAFRRAAINKNLTAQDIEDIFYNNAARIIEDCNQGIKRLQTC